MKILTQGRAATRLAAGFALVLFFLSSFTSGSTAEAGSNLERPGRDTSLLLLSDTLDELEEFSKRLEADGWLVSRLTQEGFITSEQYIELSGYPVVVAYIHRPLHPVMEEALISYAEMGGKMLILHHSIASAKVENPEWLNFLGVSILPGDREHPWSVTANTSHVLVNLAPGHYITSHLVGYDRETDFRFDERPDLEGRYPAFQLDNTEVFHNQRLADDTERVILFGYRMEEEGSSMKGGQAAPPEMEPASGWYKPAGKGWLFYLQPGHADSDFRNPGFYQVILNCLNWKANDPEFSSCSCLKSPEYVTVDLNLQEKRKILLPNGERVEIIIENVKHFHDSFRKAVRRAEVRIRVNGEETVLESGMYNLPRMTAGIQVDCPVTSGWVHNRNGSEFNPWALESDVRLRLWPGNSPWIDPGDFVYPVDAGWFSSDTQMTNDPCYVDRSDLDSAPGSRESNIYYHYGLDVGGSEGQTVIRSAVDGLVLSAADETLLDYRRNTPVAPRYDVIYLLDSRGWIYRYSHFYSINPEIRPGSRVSKGQQLGLLGKEGGSGGWSHFHFDISKKQPSGRFGSEDAYAFYWLSYFTKNPGTLQAVARPHRLACLGEEIFLNGSRSYSFQNNAPGLQFKWHFSDGSESAGLVSSKKYDTPGFYSEILEVTDNIGQTDYDFCPVFVVDPRKPGNEQPHTIHAVFYPSSDVRAREEITFKARSFGIDPHDGREIWNFGDGSPEVEVRSDGNAEVHNPEGYAVTSHAYKKPGKYLVSVSRSSRKGYTATARLKVVVKK